MDATRDGVAREIVCAVSSCLVGLTCVRGTQVSGSIKCWGRNKYGQLGLGDTNHRGDGPGEMGVIVPSLACQSMAPS